MCKQLLYAETVLNTNLNINKKWFLCRKLERSMQLTLFLLNLYLNLNNTLNQFNENFESGVKLTLLLNVFRFSVL